MSTASHSPEFHRGTSALLAWTMGALLLSTGCTTTNDSTRTSPFASSAHVDSLLAPLVAAHEFSGAVVLARKGEVVYARGFGLANHDAELAFTPDTPSDGGSIAKTFTAAAIWSLVREGAIDIDAPVTQYLPEYPHASTTVLHLVGHSNGLPSYYEYFDPHFAPGVVRTTEAMLAITAAQTAGPSFEPGSQFEYSNFGFDVAALVIERVTGKGYEEFLRERFFGPLGMDATFARPARLSEWNGARTVGYAWNDGAWQLADVYDLEAFLGASNLWFTTKDLARWGSAQALGTAWPAEVFARGQERLVIDSHPSPMTLSSWYTDARGERGYYTGAVSAFLSFVYWDRSSGDAIAMMTNSSVPPWKWITVQRALVDLLAGRVVEEDPLFVPATFTRATRAAITGTYLVDGIGMVDVLADAERFVIKVDGGLAFDAFGVSEDVFYVPGPDFYMRFGPGERAVSMQVRSLFVEGIGARVH